MSALPYRATPHEDLALHVHGVSFSRGDARILEDVGFDLPRGRFLAIVGPNGGGKSTLVEMLLGLMQPRRGHLTVLGGEPGAQPMRIGYVPQLKTFDRSFPATVGELVVSGLRGRWPGAVRRVERERVARALERADVARLAERSLKRLSGGELQRVFLARALCREPDLVVLDEPATGIDVKAGHDLTATLEAYQRDQRATIVIVTHDLAAALHHASDVLVLNRTVFGFGDPGVVLRGPCLERAYGHAGHGHGPFVA